MGIGRRSTFTAGPIGTGFGVQRKKTARGGDRSMGSALLAIPQRGREKTGTRKKLSSGIARVRTRVFPTRERCQMPEG